MVNNPDSSKPEHSRAHTNPTHVTPIAQRPHTILMIRPHHFCLNKETAADNTFQRTVCVTDTKQLAHQAQREFDAMANTLIRAGVDVITFEDIDTPAKPDAVFSNNWLSTHADGTIILYPMRASIRRVEKRQDVIAALCARFQVNRVIDLSYFEARAMFLEGTGALVLDHPNRQIYMTLSPRAHPSVLKKVCNLLKMTPLVFQATDQNRSPIYHTNVMMSIGTHFAVIGLESITNITERQQVMASLQDTHERVITLKPQQINAFAGNILELATPHNGPVIALSQTALSALSLDQKQQLESFATLCPVKIPTLEMGGGSTRCIITGIHLPQHRQRNPNSSQATSLTTPQ